MKANKLFKKLALSGVALGAAAVTLTATTFAWYTSNTSVEIQSISGMTEATAGSSDLYVARANTYANGTEIGRAVSQWGDFAAKVEPVLTGTKDSASNYENTLKPVSLNDDAGYQLLTGATTSTANGPLDTPVYANAVANNVYEYALCFRTGTASTEATPLYFSAFDFTTKKANAAVDMVAMASGQNTGISQPGVYWADLIKAMRLTVVTTEASVSENAQTHQSEIVVSSDSTKTSQVVYDLQDLVAAGDAHADKNIAEGGADAVGYLNKVLGYAFADPYKAQTVTYKGAGTKVTKGTAASEHAIAFTSIPTTGYVQVRFILWLDGWDEYCYDVMRQQEFEFSFTASTKATDAVIHEKQNS